MAITISAGISAMDVTMIILRAMRDAPPGTQMTAASVATQVAATNPVLATYADMCALYDLVYTNIKNRTWT